MKTGVLIGLGALTLAAVTVAAMPVQDAKAKTRGDDAARGDDQMAEMMEAMMKAGTPGEPHKQLAEAVGTWNAQVKSWNPMAPEAPPEESTGTSKVEMMMGGRYLVERFSGEMPGMGPFEGMGILGFNNVTSEFENIWLDSMSTGMMFSTGRENADGSVTFHGEFADCMTGQPTKCRMVSRNVSADERHFAMWCNQTGTESKMMEITYTRPGGASAR